MYDIPILFLIFKRLDTAKRVFEAIRKAAPQRLYLASDGPRNNREGENEEINIVRDYVLTSIDWDCEIKTLFREKNLGCGKAVSSAITWFFENEEKGIILEDDCLPSTSFFSYCKELLEKYGDDIQIYSIAGHNPLTETKTPYSYYYSRLGSIWGWASWRRAWNHFSFDVTNLDSFIRQKKINYIFKRHIDRSYWLDIFKKMEKPGVDIWDYQWLYTIFSNDGICINPAKNMITNIGFGGDGTHTFAGHPAFVNQKRFEITELVHPSKINMDNDFPNELCENIYGISWIWYCKNKIKGIYKPMKYFYNLLKRLFNCLFYKKIDPTVQFTGKKYIVIGKNTLIGQYSWLNVNKRYHEKHIVIGDYCFIGRNNFFTAGDLIILGDFVISSNNCSFIGSNHVFNNPCIPYYFAGTTSNKTINIGCNVFIGAYTTLVGNVNIGYGSVIGANTLIVNRNFPPFSLIVGNPGHIIKRYSFIENCWKHIDVWNSADEQSILPIDEYKKKLSKENWSAYLPYKAVGKANGNLYK